LEACDRRWCCQTIPCPPYGFSEWWFNVHSAPESPSVPSHATLWGAISKNVWYFAVTVIFWQSWCCLEACARKWCCQTIPSPPYGFSEWWFNVHSAPESPYLCPAMPLFGLPSAKCLVLCCYCKFWAKLIVFRSMWQNMMLPNHSMSSIWVQWVMIQCVFSSWVSVSVPSHATFWNEIGKTFGKLPQNTGKPDVVWRHVTEDDASKPFHVLHIWVQWV
jgi:hypothetical protein